MRSVPGSHFDLIAPREIVFRDSLLGIVCVIAVGWSLLFLH